MPSRQPRRPIPVGALALGVGVQALTACSATSVRTQLRETASHQPTPFTELYFPDPGSLPRQLPASRPSRFEFAIVNHEARATTYHYLVSGVTASTSEVLAAGDATIRVGGTKVVPVSFTPRVIGTDYLVTVQMANRAETLHFATRS